jgi:putative tryptophan/tyrosine transport system substrate-binding protein
MRRRELMLLLGGAAFAWPHTLRAQQKPMPVIGILGLGYPEDPAIALNLAAFRRGLNETGFVEGQNVAIEYRWAVNDEKRLPALAAELVARKVDVIMTEGGTPTVRAAKNATSTIPVVFHAGDAIEDGIVTNLARPDGNLTGVSLFAPERFAKQFELLAELVPETKVFALLAVLNILPADAVREIEKAARAKGVQVEILNAASDSELDAAYARLGGQRGAAVVNANGQLAEKLVALAAHHAVPAVYNQRVFATAGGLISFGVSFPAAYVIKGIYTGKILKGAKPADLPVQQPTTFELLINLKTAKALGLTVPQAMLARADEVIE